MILKFSLKTIRNGNLLKNVTILNCKNLSTLPAQEPLEPKIVTKEIPGNKKF